MNRNPLVQLTLARYRGIAREPEFVFWIFIFPLLLAAALGIAFRSSGPEEIIVGVQRGDGAAWVESSLEGAGGFRAEILDGEEARQRLRTGKVSVGVRGELMQGVSIEDLRGILVKLCAVSETEPAPAA